MLPNEPHRIRIAARVIFLLLAVQLILLVVSLPGRRVHGDVRQGYVVDVQIPDDA